MYQTSLLSGDIWRNCVLNAGPRMSTAFNYSFVFNERLNCVQWRTEGGSGGLTPPAEILKAFQNRVKLNPFVKTVKNC